MSVHHPIPMKKSLAADLLVFTLVVLAIFAGVLLRQFVFRDAVQAQLHRLSFEYPYDWVSESGFLPGETRSQLFTVVDISSRGDFPSRIQVQYYPVSDTTATMLGLSRVHQVVLGRSLRNFRDLEEFTEIGSGTVQYGGMEGFEVRYRYSHDTETARVSVEGTDVILSRDDEVYRVTFLRRSGGTEAGAKEPFAALLRSLRIIGED